jgi:hypothetical protein
MGKYIDWDEIERGIDMDNNIKKSYVQTGIIMNE